MDLPRHDASPDDPDARLWMHALRAQIDAVVLGFEAQLRQHVAATTAARHRESEVLHEQSATLQSRVDDLGAKLEASQRDALRLSNELTSREREITQLRAELGESREALQTSESSVRALESQLGELGQQVQTLDEQFVAERNWVSALLPAAGSALFDALQQSLGAPIEATPACYAALKARKPDFVLAQALRDRGRTALRSPLVATERACLRPLAEASGCELVEPAEGARFSVSTMEKVGTRSEPSEEDLVLECVTPGLRLAGSQGSLMHPRVVVGTA